jgi:hypothetical protein
VRDSVNREFVRTPEFEKCWKSLGLTEDDIVTLEEFLCANPQAGGVMEGTGGLRKLRWALPHRGKSGGIRVVYVDFMSYEKLYLISAYPKNEKENLIKEDRNEIKKFIKRLEEELRKK